MANIIEIMDFDAPELDVYARLTENQLLNRHKIEEGIFIAESPLVIDRALASGCKPISFLAEKSILCGDRNMDEMAREIINSQENVPVYVADFQVLTNLTGYNLTRGMLCAMSRPALPSLSTICQNARRIAVLENVVNPTNVGAIVRSAAALNIDAILLTPGCSNPLYRRAIRVSMGTIFSIPWTFTDDNYIDNLKKMGFKTAAMALSDDSISVDSNELSNLDKLAIILGTEGEGLCEETINACDYTVKIPMSHGVDSLNVAAASAVAFWELGKK